MHAIRTLMALVWLSAAAHRASGTTVHAKRWAATRTSHTTAGEPTAAAVSLLGDPGMTFPLARVEVEGWNFCNRAGPYADPSPRYADCGSAVSRDAQPNRGRGNSQLRDARRTSDHTVHTAGAGPRGNLVTTSMNALTPPAPIPGAPPTTNTDAYAESKERYLGDVCRTPASADLTAGRDGPRGTPWWSFWTLMAKSGNMNYTSDWCVATGTRQQRSPRTVVVPPVTSAHLLRPEVLRTNRAMNQPVVFHNWTQPGPCTPTWPHSGEPVAQALAVTRHTPGASSSSITQCGAFWGSYDVTAPNATGASLFATVWYYVTPPGASEGSMVWRHRLMCNDAYPWLMWYHRADSVDNQSGGYPWVGRGVLLEPFTAAQDVRMTVSLNVTSSTSTEVQFYLPEMGGCWKADGSPCDGDLATDITRYICFIVAPLVHSGCRTDNLPSCPPTHTFANGTVVARNDTARFPYQCYYNYCAPPNDPNPDGSSRCDPYSNPAQQELQQLLPCEEWGVHGFPSKPGQGWVGDARTWHLNVSALARQLYFASGGSPVSQRRFMSLETGPEMYDPGKEVTWAIADWDVQLWQ